MGDSRGEPSSKRSSRVFLVPSPTESGGVIYRPLSPTESDPALYTSSQDNLDGITACEDDSRRHSQYSLSSLVSQFYLPEHPRPSAGGHSHRGSYVAPSTPLSDGSTQCSVSSPYSEVMRQFSPDLAGKGSQSSDQFVGSSVQQTWQPGLCAFHGKHFRLQTARDCVHDREGPRQG